MKLILLFSPLLFLYNLFSCLIAFHGSGVLKLHIVPSGGFRFLHMKTQSFILYSFRKSWEMRAKVANQSSPFNIPDAGACGLL